MRRAILIMSTIALSLSIFLMGCHPVDRELDNIMSIESPLEPWQTAYTQLLQNEAREAREKAREEETGYSNWEGYYILYDVDKDECPELLILSLEMGRFYASLYTCPDETPILAGGYFYCGRLPNFCSCPKENGILNDAARADPSGETHWWRKFSLVDGALKEEELLDEFIGWEGEGAYAVLAQAPTQATDLIADARALDWNETTIDGMGEEPNLQPILDYTGLS